MSAIVGVIAGWYGGVAIHEIGHAGVAWFTGQGVRRVRIGSGRRCLSFRLMGATWQLGLHPFGGEVNPVRFAPLTSWPYRFLYLGGPLANIALLSLAATLALNTAGYVSAFWIGLCIPQLILIIHNLWPSAIAQNGQPQLNDGAHVALSFGSWKWLPKQFKAWCWSALAPYQVADETLDTISGTGFKMAYELDQLKTNSDTHPAAGMARVLDWHDQGKASRTEFLYLVDHVVTDWLLGGAKSSGLTPADELTRLALSYSPTNKHMRHTRGAVLSEARRYGEARAMIESAVSPDDSHFETTLNSYYLARAMAGLGELDQARDLARQARQAMAAYLQSSPYRAQELGNLLGRLDEQFATPH